MYDARPASRHFIAGVVILLLGFVLLLGQLGFVEADKIFRLWPLILIYFGAIKLRNRNKPTHFFWGVFMVLLGISFQLEELGLSHIHFGTIWPVFLICIGILLILQRYERRNIWWDASATAPPPGPTPPSPDAPNAAPPPSNPGQTASNFAQDSGPKHNPGGPWGGFDQRMEGFHERMHNSWRDAGGWYDSSEPQLNVVNIFWGGRRRIVSKRFVGGEIVTIFGGFEIDLTQADIQGSEALIEVVTIFGGGEIRVPNNWEVVLETVGIFGGTSDRTFHPEQQKRSGPDMPTSSPKKLIIKGVAIFGGLTVKN